MSFTDKGKRNHCSHRAVVTSRNSVGQTHIRKGTHKKIKNSDLMGKKKHCEALIDSVEKSGDPKVAPGGKQG